MFFVEEGMQTIKKNLLGSVARTGVVAALAVPGGAVWAQVCSYDLTTVSAEVASVPTLSTLGMAVLAMAIGFVAWRQRRFRGGRFLAVALMAVAAMLVNQGGGGLLQQAYAAVVDIV